jgi:hypothetical protein
MPRAKLPSLREFAVDANRATGRHAFLDTEKGLAARTDLLTYLGAACAGLIALNLVAWTDYRAPKLGLGLVVSSVRYWLTQNAEGAEMMAFLKGDGPQTAAVTKWMAAGRKAWR